MNKNYSELMLAIVEQAINDVKSPTVSSMDKNDARKFLRSGWCTSLLDAMDIRITGREILEKLEVCNDEN